jgi:hypothetical protein
MRIIGMETHENGETRSDRKIRTAIPRGSGAREIKGWVRYVKRGL